MIADEQPDGYVRPLVQAMDRGDDDPVGNDGPGRNEVGREQRAIERTDPPVCGHCRFPFFRKLHVSGGFCAS